jgi:hypothetical protein
MEMPRAVSALAGDQRQRSDAAERADGGMQLTPVAVLAQTTRQRGDARAPIPLDPTIILAQSGRSHIHEPGRQERVLGDLAGPSR